MEASIISAPEITVSIPKIICKSKKIKTNIIFFFK